MSAEEQHRQLAEALGKVASLASWEDLIEEVESLRNEVVELSEQLDLAEIALG